ncbi:hypothetical protein M9458_044396, partial [Cirrhinus mrigala]
PRGLRVKQEKGELFKKRMLSSLFSWYGVMDPVKSCQLKELLQDSSPSKHSIRGLRHMAAVAVVVRSAVPCEIAAAWTIPPDPEMGMAVWHTVGWKPLSVAIFPATGQALCSYGQPSLRPGSQVEVPFATGRQSRAPGKDLDCSDASHFELLAVLTLHRPLDTIATVVYTYPCGGLCSRRMLQLARHLLLWSLCS